MGYEIKEGDEYPERYIDDVEDVQFVDFKGEGVFTTLIWGKYDGVFPPLWKSKGFSWELSYDEWMTIFKSLGYIITVTEEPCQREVNGRIMLKAKFKASPDGTLRFELWFDYGNDGYYTSSSKTLDTIIVTYIKP